MPKLDKLISEDQYHVDAIKDPNHSWNKSDRNCGCNPMTNVNSIMPTLLKKLKEIKDG